MASLRWHDCKIYKRLIYPAYPKANLRLLPLFRLAVRRDRLLSVFLSSFSSLVMQLHRMIVTIRRARPSAFQRTDDDTLGVVLAGLIEVAREGAEVGGPESSDILAA